MGNDRAGGEIRRGPTIRRRAARALVAAACVSVCPLWTHGTGTGDSVTTVILVRHAEKAPGSEDPSLTSSGMARARELARTLSEVELQALYASQYVRTQETIQPIANGRGLEVNVVPVEGDDLQQYARSFARLLLERHAGGTVLVAGHSNTLPELAEALGVPVRLHIDDDDYDDLFVITVQPDGSARVLHLQYGEIPTLVRPRP